MTDKPFRCKCGNVYAKDPEIIMCCEEGVAMINSGGNQAPYMEQLKAAGVRLFLLFQL
jgi:hypothetical protein